MTILTHIAKYHLSYAPMHAQVSTCQFRKRTENSFIIVKEPETGETIKTHMTATQMQLTDLFQGPVFVHTQACERT